MLYHLFSWSICNFVHKSMVKNLKNCQIVDLDSSKKVLGCSEWNAKNTSSLQSTISEKKWQKLQLLKNYFFFAVFFWIFPETVLYRELRFFALHSVHQNLSFEVSKSAIRQFFWFFIIRTSQKLMTPIKMAENQKQRYFCGKNYKGINNSDRVEYVKNCGGF